MNDHPSLSPADRLSVIVRYLTADVIGRTSVLQYALVTAICMRLGGIAQRFAALALRVREGRLRPPRPRGERAAPARAAAPRAPRREPACELAKLPRGFAWLLPLVPGSVNFGSQLVHLLEDPEMAALVSSSPGFGRILRPMCRMLGVSPLPDILKPPPPVRRAAPPRRTAPALGAASEPGPAKAGPEPLPPMRPIYPKTGIFGGVEGWSRRSRGGFSSA